MMLIYLHFSSLNLSSLQVHKKCQNQTGRRLLSTFMLLMIHFIVNAPRALRCHTVSFSSSFCGKHDRIMLDVWGVMNIVASRGRSWSSDWLKAGWRLSELHWRRLPASQLLQDPLSSHYLFNKPSNNVLQSPLHSNNESCKKWPVILNVLVNLLKNTI